MKRKLLKMAGILGFVFLVFGLGLVLTGCEWEAQTQNVTIYVTNDSDRAVNIEITRREEGRADSTIRWNNVQPGATINRYYPSGYYSVRAQGTHLGAAWFHHPMPAGTFRRMNGTVRLSVLQDRIAAD